MHVPAGIINQAQLGDLIAEAVKQLGPEVVHVAYRVGRDSTEEPSLFFRIVLDDAAIRDDTLGGLMRRISTTLFDAVKPVENWGLRPYFNYKSKSEQDRSRDPDWV